jgi:hypothetical protein
MSRLLVIEPNLMLRYAIAVALTPDHLAQFSNDLPQASTLANVDGVIVDVAMLRQCATAVDPGKVDSWKVPTVWIDDRESTSPPRRDNWVTLTLPVQRERLLKAVFDCLNPPTGANASAKKPDSGTVVTVKTRAKKAQTNESDSPVSRAGEVIELIEVVDDDPENS